MKEKIHHIFTCHVGKYHFFSWHKNTTVTSAGNRGRAICNLVMESFRRILQNWKVGLAALFSVKTSGEYKKHLKLVVLINGGFFCALKFKSQHGNTIKILTELSRFFRNSSLYSLLCDWLKVQEMSSNRQWKMLRWSSQSRQDKDSNTMKDMFNVVCSLWKFF